jgi:hypothetical protein
VYNNKNNFKNFGRTVTDPLLFLLFDTASGLFHNESVFCTLSLSNIWYTNTLQFEYSHQAGHRVRKLRTQVQVCVNAVRCVCV